MNSTERLSDLMPKDSAMESGMRTTIEQQGKIIGDLIRTGETELYETILRGNARDWKYIQKGTRDKAALQDMIEHKIDDINLLITNIDKNIPYHLNRKKNLEISQYLMQDLLDEFYRRTSLRSIPKHEIITVDFMIAHDRIGDNAAGLFLLNDIEAGRKTLEDVKEEHKTDYKLISDEASYKELERMYSREHQYWFLQDALIPWHYSEKKYPLIDISLDKDDSRILYGAHIVMGVEEVREDLIKKVGYDIRRKSENRKYFPNICNRLLVEAFHEEQPAVKDNPYTFNIA